MELFKLKLSKFVTDFFRGDKAVNILRVSFNCVFIDQPNVKIPFLKNELIFSERLLFELRHKVKCILKTFDI